MMTDLLMILSCYCLHDNEWRENRLVTSAVYADTSCALDMYPLQRSSCRTIHWNISIVNKEGCMWVSWSLSDDCSAGVRKAGS